MATPVNPRRCSVKMQQLVASFDNSFVDKGRETAESEWTDAVLAKQPVKVKSDWGDGIHMISY